MTVCLEISNFTALGTTTGAVEETRHFRVKFSFIFDFVVHMFTVRYEPRIKVTKTASCYKTIIGIIQSY